MSAARYERILIVMAMRYEAQPLIGALGRRWPPAAVAEELEPPLPLRHWSFAGPQGGEVAVVVTGEDPVFGVDSVATQPAALATHAGIQRLRPDLILSVGTAGALPGRATIGQVFHVGGFRFHDRRIAGISDGFERYGVYARDAVPLPTLVDGAPVETAVVSTGNALNPVAEDFRIMAEHGAILKEMEGAAVAWVAGLHGVPCAGVKSVTNVYTEEGIAGLSGDAASAPGGSATQADEADQFQRHFDRAVGALADHVPRLLEVLLAPS
jgi:nucleoside phosphorylase